MRTKLFKIAQAATFGLAITFTFSCSGNDDPDGGGGGNGNSGGCPDAVTGDNTVTCGGKTYRTVQIGGQRWMAENLDYNASGSKCYDNDPANCVKYGRLYNWAAAKAVCPDGWHLSSDAEWETLTDYVGGRGTAGTKLKSTSGWSNDGNGTDDYGFSALPGGYGYSNGTVGGYGEWWSATEDGADHANTWSMDYLYVSVGYGSFPKDYLFSVRCLQD
jgi:uncharacterized protein (TIGR02145 family)